jgi:hypothetical protein
MGWVEEAAIVRGGNGKPPGMVQQGRKVQMGSLMGLIRVFEVYKQGWERLWRENLGLLGRYSIVVGRYSDYRYSDSVFV